MHGAVGVESVDRKNKTGWLERSEKKQAFAFFVLESIEKGAVVEVDGRLGGDIMKSEG